MVSAQTKMSAESRNIFLSVFFTPNGMVEQKIIEGATDEELADEFGVSPETVRNWFLRTGYRRRRRARLSKLNMARIVTLSSTGMSDEDIVNKAFSRSISASMVARAQSEMGLQEAEEHIEKKSNQFAPKLGGRRRRNPVKDPAGRHKRRSHWTPEQKQKVIQLLTSGREPYDVWRLTGASKRRQRKIAREFGVSI